MQVRSTRDSAPHVRYWERSVKSASLPRNSRARAQDMHRIRDAEETGLISAGTHSVLTFHVTAGHQF